MRYFILLCSLLCSSVMFATPLSKIVVFGDSLSDNGNLFKETGGQIPQPPYYLGRFSNGPVWIEHLIASYFPEDPNSHLEDYAIGGAGVGEDEDDTRYCLQREINTYLKKHNQELDPNSLFVVWVGPNNYLYADDVDETLLLVKNGIARSLQRLVDNKAKNILLMNIPDLGKTPGFVGTSEEEKFSSVSFRHNANLMETLNELQQKNPEVKWLHLDIHQAVQDILAQPTQFGFNEVQKGCYDLEGFRAATCEGYFFFDNVHPTVQAHQLLSKAVRTFLDDAQIEFK
jgi:phospholipase/lecithinase/hemolysin